MVCNGRKKGAQDERSGPWFVSASRAGVQQTEERHVCPTGGDGKTGSKSRQGNLHDTHCIKATRLIWKRGKEGKRRRKGGGRGGAEWSTFIRNSCLTRLTLRSKLSSAAPLWSLLHPSPPFLLLFQLRHELSWLICVFLGLRFQPLTLMNKSETLKEKMFRDTSGHKFYAET